MNRQKLLIVLMLTWGICQGQNLVPNGSFEQYYICPTWVGQLDLSKYWINPSSGVSPDYYNVCTTNLVGIPVNFMGNQLPNSGVAYGGIILWDSTGLTDFREYLETSLTSTLIANASYEFKMYVSLADFCNWTSDDIGVYFSDTAIAGYTNIAPLPFTPQLNFQLGLTTDTLNWILLSGIYTATGTENYLTIGNFKDNASTPHLYFNQFGSPHAYFYVDDVSLTAQLTAPSINLSCTDTTFCDNHCIDFFDLSTNNPTSWQWYFPGADSTTSTLQNPTNICYSNYGSFDITLIACNAVGCDTLVLPGFINEYPLPVPVITISNDTLYSSPAVAYQWWSVDNGIILGANNNYYIPSQNGNYYVVVTDSIGCSGPSNVITNTGISTLLQQSLEVSPNPFTNNLVVKLNSNETSQIILYDITLGKLITQQFISIVAINTEQLAKGIYIYEVRNKSGVIKRGKVVKD